MARANALGIPALTYLLTPLRPGLGVDIDEALAAKHPYQRAYLPIARRLDGFMHDW